MGKEKYTPGVSGAPVNVERLEKLVLGIVSGIKEDAAIIDSRHAFTTADLSALHAKIRPLAYLVTAVSLLLLAHMVEHVYPLASLLGAP